MVAQCTGDARRTRARRGAAARLLMLAVSAAVLNRSVPATCEQAGRPALVRSLTWPSLHPWEPQLRGLDALPAGAPPAPLAQGLGDVPVRGGGAGAEQAAPPRRQGGMRGGMRRTEGPDHTRAGVVAETDWHKTAERAGAGQHSVAKGSTIASPLAESIEIMKEQERQHLTQAARCRSAMRRMLMLERIVTSRDQYHSSLLPPAIAREVAAWQACGKEVALEVQQACSGAGATMTKILDNAAAIPPELMHAEQGAPGMHRSSKVKPTLSPSTSFGDMLTDKVDAGWDEELEKRLNRRRWQQPYERDAARDDARVLSSSSIPAGDTPLPQVC